MAVTLLAFGNNSSDIYLAYAAAGDDPENGNLLVCISFIFGTSFFILTIVLSMITYYAEGRKIKVSKNYFLRDITFQIIACIYMLIILVGFKKITIFETVGFVVLYLIYVSLSVYQSKQQINDNELIDLEEDENLISG